MVARTIQLQNSDEVMAMFGTYGTFYRGKWEKIRVTGIDTDDKDVPLEIRRSLVGLIIPTIFTKEGIDRQTRINFPIESGSRLAYINDVVDALRIAGHFQSAKDLEIISPTPLDMYIFNRDIYELVK